VNTCGANGVLIFSRVAPARGGRVTASSALFGEVTLPSRFLFPLLDPGAFELRAEPPGRFILLPYDAESGRPLEPGAIGRYPELSAYLARAEKTLRARRGSLIAGWIRRGYWWASLGVGRYSFAPYKVAWMSYGRSLFEPRIFRSFRGASWQGNQALHAYVPCRTRNEAKAVLRSLSRPEVSEYLESFRMGGTRSWAQPGRILRLCSFEGKGAPA
jgi:hypothetical protein